MMPVKRLYTPELLKELHKKKQEGASEDELKAQEKNALIVTWVSGAPHYDRSFLTKCDDHLINSIVG